MTLGAAKKTLVLGSFLLFAAFDCSFLGWSEPSPIEERSLIIQSEAGGELNLPDELGGFVGWAATVDNGDERANSRQKLVAKV